MDGVLIVDKPPELTAEIISETGVPKVAFAPTLLATTGIISWALADDATARTMAKRPMARKKFLVFSFAANFFCIILICILAY